MLNMNPHIFKTHTHTLGNLFNSALMNINFKVTLLSYAEVRLCVCVCAHKCTHTTINQIASEVDSPLVFNKVIMWGEIKHVCNTCLLFVRHLHVSNHCFLSLSLPPPPLPLLSEKETPVATSCGARDQSKYSSCTRP